MTKVKRIQQWNPTPLDVELAISVKHGNDYGEEDIINTLRDYKKYRKELMFHLDTETFEDWFKYREVPVL